MAKHGYVIVGGVAGGMSAAARLRRLDEAADIVIFEAGPEVSFANCGLPYYVGGEITSQDELLVQTPKSLKDSLNLQVHVNHRVTALDAAAHKVHVVGPAGELDVTYDHLILSPGATATRPPIEGLDNPHVHTLRTVTDAVTMRDLVTGKGGKPAKTAVVLGAGFIGLEAAEGLAHAGVEVTLVEVAPHVLPPLEQEMAQLVHEELQRLGVKVVVGTGASAVAEDGGHAVVRLADGQSLPADLVVLSTGVAPATQVFVAAGLKCDERGAIVTDAHGLTNLPDVWAVGDATLSTDAVTGARRPVPLAGPANRAGRLVADQIVAAAGKARRLGITDKIASVRPLPAPLGTAIVRVGRLTAAMTGANRASLAGAGIAFTTLHLHPLAHAGYFPGATQIHLLVHIDPRTGRILGAQAVGEQGVDKRIDVLATAMRANLTAPDLIDLDLCYSPPYGSAKDPVSMIGFLSDNVLTGQLALWQPDELDWARTKAFVLDVRTPEEFASGHLPEAVNIPHTSLRGRLGDVKQQAGGRPIAVTCQSGVRSYIAHRVLAAAGFDSRSLSGGMLTLRAFLGAAADALLVKGS